VLHYTLISFGVWVRFLFPHFRHSFFSRIALLPCGVFASRTQWPTTQTFRLNFATKTLGIRLLWVGECVCVCEWVSVCEHSNLRQFNLTRCNFVVLRVTLFSRAAKGFGIRQQKQLKLTVFCQAAQRKLLEFANKSNANWLYFVEPSSKMFWNSPTKWKATQIDCLSSNRAFPFREDVTGVCGGQFNLWRCVDSNFASVRGGIQFLEVCGGIPISWGVGVAFPFYEGVWIPILRGCVVAFQFRGWRPGGVIPILWGCVDSNFARVFGGVPISWVVGGIQFLWGCVYSDLVSVCGIPILWGMWHSDLVRTCGSLTLSQDWMHKVGMKHTLTRLECHTVTRLEPVWHSSCEDVWHSFRHSNLVRMYGSDDISDRGLIRLLSRAGKFFIYACFDLSSLRAMYDNA
jgi:hypothetical protein